MYMRSLSNSEVIRLTQLALPRQITAEMDQLLHLKRNDNIDPIQLQRLDELLLRNQQILDQRGAAIREATARSLIIPTQERRVA